MKRLEELPYRFWPPSALPEGVARPDKYSNVKSAEFKRAYTKHVNPVLKVAGFKCKGTTARRDDARLWRMVWYGTGNGGAGVVTIAAHVPGLPSIGEVAYTADTFEVYGACFRQSLQVVQDWPWFDLGRNADESVETARLMAEAFEHEGRAFLDKLESAEETLLGVDPADWVEPMTAHYQTFGLYLTGSSAPVGTLPQSETAQLLARLNARAGNADRARRFVELGLQAISTRFADYPHAYHTWRLRFEKLAAGDLTFRLDATDRAEVDRRVAAETQ